MISKKKKKRKKSNFPFILIFLIGFLILIYPQISMWYYKIESNSVIKVFDEEKSKLTTEDIRKRIELARQYNSSLNNVIDDDPYDDIKKAEGKKEYARMLQIKEYIGHIQIPKINEDIPMYAGTSEEVLQKGAGHLEGTSLPIGGINTHTVITAHTGLPTAKLFTALEKNMEVGDKFYIHNLAETLAYEVDQIKIVEPTIFEDLLIIPKGDYATLLTCTPYMINSHRLLVRGKRIDYVKEEAEKEIKNYSNKFICRYLLYFIIILILLILYFIYKMKRKKKLGVNNGNC